MFAIFSRSKSCYVHAKEMSFVDQTSGGVQDHINSSLLSGREGGRVHMQGISRLASSMQYLSRVSIACPRPHSCGTCRHALQK